MGAVSCVLSLSLVVLGVVGGFPVVAGAPEAGSAAGAAREGGGAARRGAQGVFR